MGHEAAARRPRSRAGSEELTATRALGVLAALLCACAPSSPPPTPGGGGEWETRSAAPSGPRQETAAVALDGEVYVIGGIDNFGNTVATVEAYDPSGDRWRAVADLPLAMHHAQAAVADGRIVVAGFLTGAFFNENGRVFRYDPGADAWDEGEPMPTGTERGGGFAATVDDVVYVFGGLRGSVVSDVSAYDPAGDSWEILPSLPESRDHLMAGAIDGVIYLAGGRLGGISSHQPTLWAFDPSDDSYRTRTAMPTSRGGAAVAVADGRLVVVGGEGNPDAESGVFANVEAYDPASDSWEQLEPMRTPRHGMAAAAVDDVVFVPGGATTQGFGAVDTHEAFTLP